MEMEEEIQQDEVLDARTGKEIVEFVRGAKRDITEANSRRVIEEIEEKIRRKPRISKSNTSLRIVCGNEKEREGLMKIKDLAGCTVEFPKP